MVAISSGSDINVLEHKQVQNDQQSNYCEFFKEWREVKKNPWVYIYEASFCGVQSQIFIVRIK